MARKKTQPELVKLKTQLARRIREARLELFGENGGPELARTLGIPSRTWYNYEIGVTVPGEFLLRFLELTGIEPNWLLRGEEPKFRPPPGKPLESPPSVPDPPHPNPVIEDLLGRLLQRLERGEIRVTWEVKQ